jgi:hypothetical protein
MSRLPDEVSAAALQSAAATDAGKRILKKDI